MKAKVSRREGTGGPLRLEDVCVIDEKRLPHLARAVQRGLDRERSVLGKWNEVNSLRKANRQSQADELAAKLKGVNVEKEKMPDELIKKRRRERDEKLCDEAGIEYKEGDMSTILKAKDTVMAKKYKHYVAGSVRKGKDGWWAKVKCIECGTERTVHTADVFQVKRCGKGECLKAKKAEKKAKVKAKAEA